MVETVSRAERMKELAKEMTGLEFVPDSLLEEYKGLWEQEAKELAQKKAEKAKEMRNRRRRGKHTEKSIAAQIGGQRKGGPGQEDIDAGLFSLETKHVKQFMSRMEKGLLEAGRHCRKNQIPIYVEKCGKHARVYLDWQAWVELHGNK